jgi:hypothetical protein
MAERNRASPEGCFERPRAVELPRAVVFLLPDAREAAGRVDALLRLREGEDARVAMDEG